MQRRGWSRVVSTGGDTIQRVDGHDIVIVGGFGHIGLPLGMDLARTGPRCLIDSDEGSKTAIRASRMAFMKHSAEPSMGEKLADWPYLSEHRINSAAPDTLGALCCVHASPWTQCGD